jgi:nucleotide sugar dehydrogenase
VKLAETTYRDVNIGLANQFAKFADKIGINVHEIISASNSQPFSHIHNPGIAVGGHCIPIYPQFYLWKDPDATIVKSARTENQNMPEYALQQIEKRVGILQGSKVLILGVSYRDQVKELAFSGSLVLCDLLIARGATVHVLDPLYSDEELRSENFIASQGNYESYDVVIIQNSSKEFLEILTDRNDFSNLKLIFDGRNILNGVTPIKGVEVVGIGIGVTAS